MRPISILTLLLLTFAGTYAQEANFSKPDFKAIEQTTHDSTSVFYFPSLYRKYRSNDPDLTLRDYRAMYYGYFFQDGYSSFEDVEQQNKIQKYFLKKDLSAKDWNAIIELNKGVLAKAPFNLRQLNLMFVAYENIGDTVTAATYAEKVKKIADVILSSGDGRSEETAFYVLAVSDEYSILSILGFHSLSQSLSHGQCDVLSLEKNKQNIPALYFDVKQIFEGYAKMFGTGDKKHKKRK